MMSNIPSHRRWMYNRTYPTRGGLKLEFIDGVETFIKHAKGLQAFKTDGVIRCPCSKCLRKWDFLSPATVTRHLYSNGFKPNYWYWTDHGEIAPREETATYFDHASASTRHEDHVLHTGGSISAATNRKRLSERENREVAPEEIFKITRIRKSDKKQMRNENGGDIDECDESNDQSNDVGGDRWVDERSRSTWEMYVKLKEMRNEQAALLSEDEMVNLPTDIELLTQAGGGPNKKGEVYGMPYLKSKCSRTSTSTSSQSCSTSSAALPELDELKKQQQELLEQHAALRQQMLEEQAKLRRQQEQILSAVTRMASMFQQQRNSNPDVQRPSND